MKKQIHDLRVVENKKLNSEYFELVLTHDEPFPEILPGQFAEVRVDHSSETFLRRPISVYDIDYHENRLHFLIQIVGKGTFQLSLLRPGETLNIIYPLGNSFDTEGVERALLIGGGVGIAPLLFLGHRLQEEGKVPLFLLGFRSDTLFVDFSPFERYGRLWLTTEDGSAGEKGLVTDHSVLQKELDIDRIYTCGPKVMMKAVSELAARRGVDTQASLENTMACGFGACLCCAQETVHGNKMVCIDGPVFHTNELIWQS